MRHQALEGGIGAAFGNLCFAYAEFFQVFLRQINSAFLPIHGHVLPEVDELQGGADAVALGEAERVGMTIEVQQQSADRIGTAAGIIHQLAKVLIAGFHYVLAEGGKQVVEGLERKIERPHSLALEPLHQFAVRGLAGGQAVELCPQVIELAQAFFVGQIAFVSDVVGNAGERIDGVHRSAQAARQNQRADGEIFVVSD